MSELLWKITGVWWKVRFSVVLCMLKCEQCLFQAIKSSLDNLQPKINELESQQQDAVGQSTSDEAARIRGLLLQLKEEWASVNTSYNQRHE